MDSLGQVIKVAQELGPYVNEAKRLSKELKKLSVNQQPTRNFGRRPGETGKAGPPRMRRPKNAGRGPRPRSNAVNSVGLPAAPRAVRYGNAQAQPVRMRRREHLASVSSTGTSLNVSSYVVQPGLSSYFPWLSGIAGAYERYRFNSLSFEFIPSAAFDKDGTVILSPEYDVTNPVPTLINELTNTKGAVQGSVRSTHRCHFDPQLMYQFGNSKSIRVSVIPQAQDIKLYDSGKLNLAFMGVASGVGGELYVEYDVMLMVPSTRITATPSQSSISHLYPDTVTISTAGTYYEPAGYTIVNNAHDISTSSDYFILPAGHWRMEINWAGVIHMNGAGSAGFNSRVLKDGVAESRSTATNESTHAAFEEGVSYTDVHLIYSTGVEQWKVSATVNINSGTHGTTSRLTNATDIFLTPI